MMKNYINICAYRLNAADYKILFKKSAVLDSRSATMISDLRKTLEVIGMARAESITFEEFRTGFSSEDACRHQTSVTAGTVMHRTHLPLTIWFWAIYLCATDKRGISAVQRRGTDKAKIVVALSKTENGAALFTRMQVVEDVTGGTLQQVVDETVAPGSKIECDGYRSYKNLSGVELDAKKYEPGDLHWLHKAISNLKAFLLGTYHGRCTQLQSYLDEFCFRFNRRKTGDQIFLRLARAVAASCAQLH